MSDGPYDPATFSGLTFAEARPSFEDGSDSPSAYLERCLQTVEDREPVVQAFAHLNVETAKTAAAESDARWKAGRPWSPIDGMPIPVKDLLETRDMPTEMNCAGLKGNFPKRDNAAVMALRQAGAVIFGKSVTAELGGSHPGPTTNPFDATRTPGGSSSGAAAAVAAGMAPAAIGTQVGGSIIRPAGFCGNLAFKPSQGGINRGERQATSMSTHGVHANCVDDMWRVAMEIVARVGGDRGGPGVMGPMAPPSAKKPDRLIVLETAGWTGLDDASKAGFEQLLGRLNDAGVELLRRSDTPAVERLETAIVEAGRIAAGITGWENQWLYRNLLDGVGDDAISHRAKAILAKAETLTVDGYRALLEERAQAQVVYGAMAGLADAAITLACPGPAPVWDPSAPAADAVVRPTGDAIFNYPSSMLFAPAVTTPLLAVGAMPVGVQAMGWPGGDAATVSIARWMSEAVKPVSV